MSTAGTSASASRIGVLNTGPSAVRITSARLSIRQ